MRRRRPAIACALVAALAAASGLHALAQEEPGTADRRRVLAARVARLRGRASTQAPGDEAWTALGDQALLGSGDRVKAEDGAVELILPGDEAAVRDTSQDGGDRVLLAPDARVTIGPPSGADVRLDQGEVWAVGAGGLDVEAALADLDRALGLDGARARTWLERGLLLVELGEAEPAVADLTHALGLDPGLAEAWWQRAQANAALRRRDDVRRDLDGALAVAPDHVPARLARAALRRDAGQLDLARDDLRAALAALPPDDPRAADLRRTLER